ncbi:hypothetical protein V7S43_003982 [Phytophthora oleae]|uniref:START domain-containing protein n=1 Tax=Phytophthora oleae TaxID=2107226 RepID=A0ABD3FYS8_9STRA
MSPQLAFRHPTTESDLSLSDFLHEMDDFDCFQDISQEFIDSKLRQGLNVVPEPAKSQKIEKAAPRKRRSTSWLRRKQELTALRSESEALETHLTFLRMEIDRRATLQQSMPTVSEDSGMWQSVALLARQECESSQNENDNLKNEVQMYARASEMLQTQLAAAEGRRQQLLSNALMIEGRLGGLLPTCVLSFDNEEVLDALEQRINARFHELDWIMREAYRPIQGGTTVQICREENHSAAAVEFRYVRLLPFGEDAMANSIWEIIELGGVITRTNTRVARIASDMVGLVSHHSVPFGCNTCVDVDVHTVIKRFAVSTGMVALIESHSEWSIKYPATETLRSTTDEGGWFVVHEYPLRPSVDVNQRASQLKTSMKLRPMESQTGNTTPLTSTIVDVVIPSFREILSWHHQSVENFLLDTGAQ